MTIVSADPGTRALRTTLGRFATGVAVVTTVRGNGIPAGVTINSFASVSLDPPLVLWCLSRASSTLSPFLENPLHAINILTAGQERLARQFTAPRNRFTGVALETQTPPVLADTAAHLICRTREILNGGDHIIVLSEALTHHKTTAPPLLFLDGRYSSTEGTCLPDAVIGRRPEVLG